MERRDLDLCPDPLGISAELVPNTLGCPQGRALPTGAGMLQGWHLGVPARAREGQSLEHQNFLHSLSSPGIFPHSSDVEGKIYCPGVPTEHPMHRVLCAGESCEPQTHQEQVQHLFACPALGL